MSLDWICEKVADYEALHENNLEWVKTQVLAFALVGAGLGRITTENYKQVFSRISLWEKLFGAQISGKDNEDIYYTLDDIKRRIGYSTNVSDESDTVWLKSVLRVWNN